MIQSAAMNVTYEDLAMVVQRCAALERQRAADQEYIAALYALAYVPGADEDDVQTYKELYERSQRSHAHVSERLATEVEHNEVTCELSSEDVYIIEHALKQTFLFDGPGSCPDYDAARNLLHRLNDNVNDENVAATAR